MSIFGKWRKEADSDKGKEPVEESVITDAVNPQPVDADSSSLGGSRTILVVDDNDIVLKTFQLKLKSLGFKVLLAKDGSAAVSAARQQRPDLIVLDINFPPDVGSTGLQWDGFNVMEWMRRFREVANIPVFIITSGDPAKYKAKALAFGAVAFFQKPINHEEFIIAVRRVLGQGAAPAAQAV